MTRSQIDGGCFKELADFLASQPNRLQILKYRPSTTVQQRASELLLKQNEGEISSEERRELDQFAFAEVLMRLIKAKLRLSNQQDG